jgi:MFS transporter, DHA1 family, multidrug resistance protein
MKFRDLRMSPFILKGSCSHVHEESTVRDKEPGSEPCGIGFVEFVVLIASIAAAQALAIDIILPALPIIAHELALNDKNRGQWIVTAYAAGVSLGQLYWGLLSDRYGRRVVLLTGLALYAVAAMICGLSESFNALLGWRLIHGVAAASMVVVRSAVRDRYSGCRMARVMSLTFILFLIVPIIAPSIGQWALWLAPWRYIFVILSAFATVIWLWTLLRLPETLHADNRQALTWSHVLNASRLVLGNRESLHYTLAATTMFGFVLAYVGTIQQIFEDVFHRSTLMPVTFALCAVATGGAAFLNSRIVERVGMRVISHVALVLFIAINGTHFVVAALGFERMWGFVALQAAAMGCCGVVMSNFSAIAMGPLSSVAGIGAALQGFITTLGAAALGAVIGGQFNGSILPLVTGGLVCGLVSLMFTLTVEDGRRFRLRAKQDPI